jgi:hypothetical protein
VLLASAAAVELAQGLARSEQRARTPVKLNTRRNIAVLGGFAALIGLSALVNHFLSQVPSPQQACNARCSAIGKQGRLSYSGPATPKEAYKEAHSECRCE